MTRNIHLVGSVPMTDPTAVFTMLGERLGAACARYPDGETGDRTNWIAWQVHAFADNPALVGETAQGPVGPRQMFHLREGHEGALAFGTLGYARTAIASFAIFQKMRASGAVPAGIKFQVSLPTPVAIASAFARPDAVRTVAAALDRRMHEELAELLAAIPHGDLAIQWDCATEPITLAGGWPDLIGGMRDYFLSHTSRLIDAVPDDVAVGVHLCYGDPGHKHVIEPIDLALCVDLANALATATSRRIDWFHMPIPRDRNDDAYFSPLAKLTLPQDCELVLGLIHFADGIDGARRRMTTARRHRDAFSIATECGLGRRDPATIPELLDFHVAAATC